MVWGKLALCTKERVRVLFFKFFFFKDKSQVIAQFIGPPASVS